MSDNPKLARHVKLGDHQFVVDGQDFPWYVAPDVEVTETGHVKIPYLVHVKIIPVAVDTREKLAVTCPPTIRKSPSIGDRPFPWLISEAGYRVVGTRPCPTLHLAFLAEQLEDVRS